MCTHVEIRTLMYDVRVQRLYVNAEEFQPREARHIQREKQCTYGLSDWFKVGQNRLKAISRQSTKSQVYRGLFESKSVTMSVWPIAGLLGCVLYLF